MQAPDTLLVVHLEPLKFDACLELPKLIQQNIRKLNNTSSYIFLYA
jgi:hypothetical protein